MKSNNKAHIWLKCVFISFTFLYTTSVYATDYYTSPSGSDSNSGKSLQMPFKTISKAARTASPGDTVYITAGIYSESIVPSQSGISGSPITFKNYGSGDVIVTNSSDTYAFDLQNRQYINIEGIKFQDAYGWVYMDNAHHNSISNCTFHGSRNYHSLKINSSNYNKITNCIFEEAIPWAVGSDGYTPTVNADFIDIWRDSHYNLIENCVFSKITHAAIMIHGREPQFTATHNIIRNCNFNNPGWKAIGIHKTEYTLIENCVFDGEAANFIQYEAPKVILRKNIFHHYRDSTNGQPSVDFRGVFRLRSVTDEYNCNNLAQHNRIYNNIFYDNDRTITSFNPYLPVYDNIFKNNIFYNNRQTAYLCYPDYRSTNLNYFFNNLLYGTSPNQTIITLENDQFTLVKAQTDLPALYKNNREGDPMFIDSSQGNYRLKQGSSCVDTGTFLTYTIGSGNGTALPVEDPLYFCDGFGLIEGDTIIVGSNAPVKISRIDYNAKLITIDRAINWDSGNAVALIYSGSAPDMGVFEYIPLSSPPKPPTGLRIVEPL